MARITSVEKRGPSSWAFGFPGGKVAGTTDQELGERLVAAFDADPEHCLVELALEKRGERLHITAANYIEAPAELGGPADEPAPSAEESTDAASTEPDFSLEALLDLEKRVSMLESAVRVINGGDA